MKSKVELYSGTYKNYAAELYNEIRKDTYGEDIGQTSWITADEYRQLFSILNLSADKKVLEIATGSGGPAVFMVNETGCTLVGVEIDEEGVRNANELAANKLIKGQAEFLHGDASTRLPFPDQTFDVVICMDAINHLADRQNVLGECFRLLKEGGKLLYTDPIVVTGILTNEEIAGRSLIGYYLFVPVGENERLLQAAGFKEVASRDVTENMASTSIRWQQAREKRSTDLVKLEGESTYAGLQSFLHMVHLLSAERRLSRVMFTAIK